MLVDVDTRLLVNPILALVAMTSGRSSSVHRMRKGVYEIGHFGSSDFLGSGWNYYPVFDEYVDDNGLLRFREPYGVCDSLEQVLQHYPELEASPDRKFIVTLTTVLRDTQSETGGWRWRKWGEYIGSHTPKHEYLYDEKDIDKVIVYHIYEKSR